MVKIGIDVDGYAPAGYTGDVGSAVRALSILHDSGTGSSLGSFGHFETMPVVCKDDSFDACSTLLDARMRNRTAGKDAASPGYFTTTLDNGMKLEATTTRRAGLQRYTFPAPLLANSGCGHTWYWTGLTICPARSAAAKFI